MIHWLICRRRGGKRWMNNHEWRKRRINTQNIYIHKNIFIITLFYYIYKHKNSKQKPKKSRWTLMNTTLNIKMWTRKSFKVKERWKMKSFARFKDQFDLTFYTITQKKRWKRTNSNHWTAFQSFSFFFTSVS